MPESTVNSTEHSHTAGKADVTADADSTEHTHTTEEVFPMIPNPNKTGVEVSKSRTSVEVQ